jgi:phosphoribosylpyrophosphate synthetase
LLTHPSAAQIEAVMLVRLGDRVPIAKRARELVRALLVRRLESMVRCRSNVAITTMPRRYGSLVEHTFVSFVEDVARDLDVECVNDQFVEVRPRSDVSDLARHERGRHIHDAWIFRGALNEREVLLVDDVIDTGNSIEAAASVLERAGAQVLRIALLRLQNENDAMEAAIRKYFGCHYRALLDVPEVQGSLRRMLESWSSSAPFE